MEMCARLPFASRGMQPFLFSFWKNVGGLTVSVGSPPMETTLRFLGHACVALLGERVQLLFEREAIGARNAQIDACLNAVMGKPRCFFD